MISKLETGPARIRKQDKHDSETGMGADSETVIRKLGQHDSENGPARIRKQDKHDSETGMSADSETVIRKLGQTWLRNYDELWLGICDSKAGHAWFRN